MNRPQARIVSLDGELGLLDACQIELSKFNFDSTDLPSPSQCLKAYTVMYDQLKILAKDYPHIQKLFELPY